MTPLDWTDRHGRRMSGTEALHARLAREERRRVRAERRLLVVIALAIVAVTVAIGVGL